MTPLHKASNLCTTIGRGFLQDTQTLIPAQELAATNTANFPNESGEYRRARNAPLVEEIELRRALERVASQRVRYLAAVRFRGTSSLPLKAVPFFSLAYSETKTR